MVVCRFARLASLFGCLLVLAACQPQAETKRYPHAILTPSPKPLPAVSLTGGDGKPLDLGDFAGKWLWIYFGFTHCPDVCPTAMQDMADAYGKLEHPEQVQPVFISVDPKRDTPAVLKQYAAFYDPAFVAATGDRTAIDTLSRALGIGYVIDPPPTPGGPYNVSHSNLITVIDPQGRYTATYVPGADDGHLADDFNTLTAR